MNVAVLGAGSDGRDIATVCARVGHAVSLHSTEATRAMDSIDNVEHRLVTAHDRGEIDDRTRRDAIDGLEATTSLRAAVSDAGVVIDTETTDGNLQERFAEVEDHVERETLIASSRLEVSVTAAAAGLRHPDRAIGLNFFDLPATPVVEIIFAEQTTGETAERAEEFVTGLGTTAVRVRDAPGIASTRLALALEVEAMRAVDDGVISVEGADHLLREGLDFPIGPLERADRAGLADRLDALEVLSETLGDRFDPPAVLAERVAEGKTGADAGEGFYVWESGEPTEAALPGPELAQADDQPDDPAHR
jgi:3-hydroxybutyryl-CoA dehydrogenase